MSNRNLTTNIFVLLLCTVTLFTACKKKEIPGPKGEPGTPGGGGNSNITSGTVFTVSTSQWVADTVNDYLKVTINAPELTKLVVEKGAVKVYKQVSATWTELPLVTGDLFTQFGFNEGHLYIMYINIEGGLPSAPATAAYRMVILSESARTTKPLNVEDQTSINKTISF